MNVVRVSCAVIALSFVLVTSAAAQSTSLETRVTDPARAVVVGAPVILTHVQSGRQQTGLTRNDGTFRFTGLTPGEYRVEIAATGFSLYAGTITLGAGDGTVEAVLEIAPILEDVMVRGVATVPTIGRVSTPLRDQPLTVNTLTSEYLESNSINDLVTALQNVPNVNAYNQYGVYQYYTFRGFRSSVQMVDGVRNEGNRVATQLANVERIEVLKGPASVLYGGDAIGGTVNIVLKKPSAEPSYELTITAGRWDTYRGSFGASGRLRNDDSLLYRLDIGGESATNFRNDEARKLNVTSSVMWRLSNGGQVDARYSFDRTRGSGDSGIPLVPLSGGFTPDPTRTAIGDPLARAIQGDGSDVIPLVSRDSRYNTPQDFSRAIDRNLRVSYSQAFGQGFAFRNTVGFRHYADEYFVAEFLDVTPPSQVNRGFLYFQHNRRPVTNQAELSGRARLGVDHDFLLGWDYQHHGNQTDRRQDANLNTTPMDLFNPVETHISVNLDNFPITRKDYRRDSDERDLRPRYADAGAAGQGGGRRPVRPAPARQPPQPGGQRRGNRGHARPQPVRRVHVPRGSGLSASGDGRHLCSELNLLQAELQHPGRRHAARPRIQHAVRGWPALPAEAGAAAGLDGGLSDRETQHRALTGRRPVRSDRASSGHAASRPSWMAG